MVIALGGNAILQRGESGSIEEQYRNVANTVKTIADLIEAGYRVVITHGNGPQIGATLLRHEAGKDKVPPFPLDACGAETQGFIGYMIQQALRNELKRRKMDKYIVTIITRVIIDDKDPAFNNPTKPIGPFYTKENAERILRAQPGIVIKEDAGRGYRRVVPSPEPKIIAERFAIRALIDAGFVVVACGGGGIPITEHNGHAQGIEAVIDKDLAGERLASLIGADRFVILTDVEGVYSNYGSTNRRLLKKVTAQELKRLYDQGHFKPGSMAPKVLAATRFVEGGGKEAIIAELGDLRLALEGDAGTHVTLA